MKVAPKQTASLPSNVFVDEKRDNLKLEIIEDAVAENTEYELGNYKKNIIIIIIIYSKKQLFAQMFNAFI